MSDVQSSVQPNDRRARLARAIGRVWWVILMRGVLLVVLGGCALFLPFDTLAAFAQLLAIFAIFDGVFALMTAALGEKRVKGWSLGRGAVCILLGMLVLTFSRSFSLVVMTIIVCIFAIQVIVAGILEILVGLQHRREMEGEGWLILGGILSIIFGSMLLAAPVAFGLVLIRLIGIFVILFGAVMIRYALRARAFALRMSGAP
jgi:uncharacterized membrane protein HdeD (DUF308 family)